MAGGAEYKNVPVRAEPASYACDFKEMAVHEARIFREGISLLHRSMGNCTVTIWSLCSCLIRNLILAIG